MLNVYDIIDRVLVSEGGYAFDPDDPGGETYKGIARKFNADWPGWELVDRAKKKGDFPYCLDENRVLHTLVVDRYKENYWSPIRGAAITDIRVAYRIFDMAVNAGPRTSIRLAQSVSGAVADGKCGPNTIKAINEMNPDQFLAAFSLARVAYYTRICEKRSKSRKYFYGWIKRVLA